MICMVTYTDSLKGIIAEQLTGFFVGWPNPPSPDVHLRMLQGSYHVWLALDGERVVGFVSAISDGVLSADARRGQRLAAVTIALAFEGGRGGGAGRIEGGRVA